ncbi:MAG: hypothetical protein PWQ43_743 [Rikenellaceae bacterium]|nr:hypothetical protein [Rikenellaceae bacterium]
MNKLNKNYNSWEKSKCYNTKEHTIYYGKNDNGVGFHDEHILIVARMGKTSEF